MEFDPPRDSVAGSTRFRLLTRAGDYRSQGILFGATTATADRPVVAGTSMMSGEDGVPVEIHGQGQQEAVTMEEEETMVEEETTVVQEVDTPEPVDHRDEMSPHTFFLHMV